MTFSNKLFRAVSILVLCLGIAFLMQFVWSLNRAKSKAASESDKHLQNRGDLESPADMPENSFRDQYGTPFNYRSSSPVFKGNPRDNLFVRAK